MPDAPTHKESAGAIVLHNNRRKVVLYLGIGILIAGFLLLVADSIMKSRIVGQVSPNAVFSSEAASEAYNTITSGLTASIRAAVFLGLLLWLGAYALGPSPSMVSARIHLRDWIHELGKNRASPGSAELWIGAHRHAIQIGVLILASVALIVPTQRSVTYIIVLAGPPWCCLRNFL